MESITFTKGDRQREVTARVAQVKEGVKEMGGVEPKSRLEVTAGRGEHTLQMFVKVASIFSIDDFFGDEKVGMSKARRYYERWRYLKSIGIPTVSSMRVVDEQNVAMADMVRDGSFFFGKEATVRLLHEADKKVRRKLTPMERKFLAIPPDTIKAEMKRVAVIAKRNGIRLPIDGECEVLVHPDGRWELVVLDLSELDHFDTDNVEKEVYHMFAMFTNARDSLEKIAGGRKIH